ncbi:MAG: hypothetical protein EOO55_03650 [Hymenobacter sp.]|nr:MAG: hypothetical protein EOO55_03650 [Hymenobacter sp.]
MCLVIKQLLITCATLAPLVGCGQQPAEQPKAGARPVVRPPQPLLVPGTHVQLAPPTGFRLSAGFTRLERDKSTTITVVELAGGSFYKTTRTFDPQEFKAKGVTVLDYQETHLGGYPAKYLYLQATAAAKTHILAFGDSTFTVLLTGLFSASDEVAGQQIKQALFSSTYQKKALLAPFATATFNVAVNESKFKFVHYSGSMYTYTAGKATDKMVPDRAVMVLVPLPTASESTASFAKYLMKRLAGNGLTNSLVKNESYVKVNGYNAYEAEVYGKLRGIDALFYVLYLTHGEQSLFIQGITSDKYEENKKEFKKFTRAIRFKP